MDLTGSGNMAVTAILPIVPAATSLFVILTALLGGIAALLGLSRQRHTREFVRRFLWHQRYSLLVLAIIAGSGAALASWVRETIQTTRCGPAPIRGMHDWPVFRGDPSRQGSVQGSPPPNSPGIVWSSSPATKFYASPAISGDAVYCVGSSEDRGHIYCRDAHTGTVRWIRRPAHMRATLSSPVVAGNRLVCGEGLHHTTDARVFCLDISAGAAGELLWTFETHGHVEGTPWIDGNRVYVTAGDDGVYALRLEDLAPGQERRLWHVDGKSLPDAETCLAVVGDKLVVGLGTGEVAILLKETGEEVERLRFPYPVHAPPAVVGGKLYLGLGRGDYVDVATDAAGQVACVDMESFQTIWQISVPATILGALAADEAGVTFCCADGIVRRVSSTGELQYQWNSHAPIVSSPAVAGGTVYVVNRSGTLFALDRRGLEPLWEQQLGPPGLFISSPVVAHGHLYIGTDTAGFLCVGRVSDRSSTDFDSVSSTSQGLIRNASDRSLAVEAGTARWHVDVPFKPRDPSTTTAPHSRQPQLALFVDHERVICGDGATVNVYENRGDAPPRALRRLGTTSHDVAAMHVTGSLILGQETPTAGSATCRRIAWNRETLEEVWSEPCPPHSRTWFTRRGFLVGLSNGRLESRAYDNTKLWGQESIIPSGPPCAVDGILFVPCEEPRTLVALDEGSGDPLWSIPLEASARFSQVVGHRLFHDAGNRLITRSVVDGSQLTSHEFDDAIRSLEIDEAGGLCRLKSGAWYMTDRNGEEWRAIPREHTRAGCLRIGNGFLGMGGGRISHITPFGRHAGTWADLTSMGELAQDASSPAVVWHRGRLYILDASGGLTCYGGTTSP